MNLLTTSGVLAVAGFVTLIAFLENWMLPWAPFFLGHVVLAFAVPLRLGTYTFGSLLALGSRIWILLVLAALGLQIVGAVWAGVLFPSLLGALGIESAVLQTPYYSAQAALNEVFRLAADRMNLATSTLSIAYLVFVALWAGLGEELFYRGYVHGELEKTRGFVFAAIVSSALFAVRHAAQLALPGLDYPWGASVSWVVFSFAFGLGMSWLYSRFGSLYPPVIVHYVFNGIALLAVALGGRS